tara:strand:- start:911 stop:1285 length:375 start_codon:yes stop_codon:yes gene_type:complete
MSLYDLGVAYGNLTILTEGALGTSPLGVVAGATNLSSRQSGAIGGRDTSMILSGASEISLGDILTEPGLAFSQIQSNLSDNWLPMGIAAVTFNAGARIFKRTMRQPINTVNRVIFKPLKLGVRI